MRSGTALFGAIVAGVCAACGGLVEATSAPPAADAGVTNAATADAGTPDAPPDVHAKPDAHAKVRLLEITPADGALHVSVLTTVTLRYSGSLDAASVTAANVRLLPPNATIAMPADVTYDDATYTITLSPKTALAISDVHRLAASGLRAADGSPLPEVASSFTTLYDAAVRGSYVMDGSPSSPMRVCSLDALGRSSRCAMSYSNDASRIWAYSSFAYGTPSGSGTYRSVYFNAAGPDGAWYTADDAVQSYFDIDTSRFGRTRFARYSLPGPDKRWQTADDIVGEFEQAEMTPEGLIATDTVFGSPGPDGVIFTADDIIQSRTVWSWTAAGGRSIRYDDPGPDAIWGTSDDRVTGFLDYVRDSLGRITTLLVGSMGPDAEWLTPDDGIQAARRFTFDARGLLVQDCDYASPGPDGVWLTADDLLDFYIASTFDAAGATVTRTSYHAGPDGVWFTSDDAAWYTEQHDTTR